MSEGNVSDNQVSVIEMIAGDASFINALNSVILLLRLLTLLYKNLICLEGRGAVGGLDREALNSYLKLAHR